MYVCVCTLYTIYVCVCAWNNHIVLDHTNCSSFLFIQSFEAKFELAKGINKPKIVVCCGSNGLQYKQLVKVLHS